MGAGHSRPGEGLCGLGPARARGAAGGGGGDESPPQAPLHAPAAPTATAAATAAAAPPPPPPSPDTRAPPATTGPARSGLLPASRSADEVAASVAERPASSEVRVSSISGPAATAPAAAAAAADDDANNNADRFPEAGAAEALAPAAAAAAARRSLCLAPPEVAAAVVAAALAGHGPATPAALADAPPPPPASAPLSAAATPTPVGRTSDVHLRPPVVVLAPQGGGGPLRHPHQHHQHQHPAASGSAPPPTTTRYSLTALRTAGRAFTDALPPALRGAYALSGALPSGCAAPLAVLAAAWGWSGEADGGSAAQRTLGMAQELAQRGVLQIAAPPGEGGGGVAAAKEHEGGGGMGAAAAASGVGFGRGGQASDLWRFWVAAAADHLAYLQAAHEGTRAMQDAHARVLDLYLLSFGGDGGDGGGRPSSSSPSSFASCVAAAAAAAAASPDAAQEEQEDEAAAAAVALRADRLRRAALAAAPREGGYLLRAGFAHHLAGAGRAGRGGELRAALLQLAWLERRMHAVGVAPLAEDLRRCLSCCAAAPAGVAGEDEDALLRLLLRALQAGLPACDDRPGLPMLRRQLLLRMIAAARAGGRGCAVRGWYARERAEAERDGAAAFARAFAEAERAAEEAEEEEAESEEEEEEGRKQQQQQRRRRRDGPPPPTLLSPPPTPPCHLLCRAPTLAQAGSAHRSSLRTHGPPLRCCAILGRDAMVGGDDGGVTVYDADMAGEAVLRLSLGPLPTEASAAAAARSSRGSGSAAAAAAAAAARVSGASLSDSAAAAGGAPAVMPRWDQGACVTALAAVATLPPVRVTDAGDGDDADDADAAAPHFAPPRHSLCLAGDAAGRLIAWDLTAGGALVAAVVAHRRPAAAGLPPLPPQAAGRHQHQQRASSVSSRPSSAGTGAAGGALHHHHAPRSAPVAVVAASEDGELVLTAAAADPRARVWRLPALSLAAELPHAEAERQEQQQQQQQPEAAAAATAARMSGGSGGVLSAALSPDGALAVTTGSGDHAAVVWDVAAATAHHHHHPSQQQQQQQLRPRVLRGHEGWVVSATFAAAPDAPSSSSPSSSPSSSWLVLTASHDGTARVWSAATGACLHVLRGHDGRLGDISAAAACPRAITAGDDATARLWDLRTGACLAVLGPEAHRGWVSVCGMDAAGALAVTADGAGSVACWELPLAPAGANAAAACSPPPEPKPIAIFAGAHAREVTGLRLTRRGGFAVTCGADGSARLFDLRAARAAARALAAASSGATPRCSGASASSEAQAAAAAMVASSVGAHEGRVRGVVAAAAAGSGAQGGGGLLAVVSSGDDGALRAWDACGTGECLAAAPNAHGCAVQWLSAARLPPPALDDASAAAVRVVSASGDRRVAAWSFYSPDDRDASASALEPRDPPRALLPSALGSRTKSVAVSEDGAVALVVLFDSTVTAYRLNEAPSSGSSAAAAAAAAASPRPSDASRPGAGGSARSSMADEGPAVLARLIRRGERGAHSGGVNEAALSRCGRVAVTASKDATARVWGLPDSRVGGGGPGEASCTAVLRGHADAVTCALLLDEEDEEEAAAEEEEEGQASGGRPFSSSSPSPPAPPLPPRLVATGSADGDVRVWDLRTGACLAVLSPPLPPPPPLEQAGGGAVASAAAAAAAAAASGGADEEAPPPPGVRALGWDGRGLLFSLDDAEAPRSRARLWSLRLSDPPLSVRPRLVASLVHSSGVPVHAAAFGGGGGGGVSPRHRRRPLLATGGADCSVILWHAATGTPLAFFVADAPVTSLAFASLPGGCGGSGRRPAATTVVAGDAGGRVHCVVVPEVEEEDEEEDASR